MLHKRQAEKKVWEQGESCEPGEGGLGAKGSLSHGRLALCRYEHRAASALGWVLAKWGEHGAGRVTLPGGGGWGCRLSAPLTATAELARSRLSVDNVSVKMSPLRACLSCVRTFVV